MKTNAAATCVLCLMLVSTSYSQTNQPSSKTHAVTDAPTSKIYSRGDISAPIYVHDALDQEELSEKRKQATAKDALDTRLALATEKLALYTLLLCIGTVGLAVGTVFLVFAAVKQGVDTRRSLNISERAATAASNTLTAMISAELPLFVPESYDLALREGNFKVVLGNHGRTPAFVIRHCLNVSVLGELPQVPQYSDIHNLASIRAVEKGGIYNELSTQIQIGNELRTDLIAGRKHVWAYGFLDFIDYRNELRRYGFIYKGITHPAVANPVNISVTWQLDFTPRYSYSGLADDIKELDVGADSSSVATA